MKINFKQASEFLEKVNEKDNIMMFTHSDLDGFAAAILLKDYCNLKGAKVDVRIINYGVTRISDTNVKKFNKVFLTDLAPGMIWEDLAKLKDKEIFYTDHHQDEKDKPIADFILELRTTSGGYFPSTRTVYELLEEESKDKLWIATLGTLSDMAEKYPENTEFLQKCYKQLNLTHGELMKYLFKLNFALIGNPSLENSFEEISKFKSIEDITKLAKYYVPVEKELERLKGDYEKKKEVFGKIIYYYLEANYPGIKSTFINVISGEEKDKVLIFSTPKKGETIGISIRNQSKEYDVAKLLQSYVAGLSGGNGGGHKSAAGGQVDRSDLGKFKERIKQIKLGGYRMQWWKRK